MKNISTRIFGLLLIRKINLMCKPVKGKIIQDDNYSAHFYEYKANGKDLKKNGVSIYARFFTFFYPNTEFLLTSTEKQRKKNYL